MGTFNVRMVIDFDHICDNCNTVGAFIALVPLPELLKSTPAFAVQEFHVTKL